jgi:hypothetical protein
MLVKRKKTLDNIPTLNDRVEEGKSAGETESAALQTALPRSSTEKAEPAPQRPPTVAAPEPLPRTRTAFEITIETMVAEILNRHLTNAREEITRAVLAEVRARLSNRQEKPEKN